MAVAGLLRRRRAPEVVGEPVLDPRADELRRKLAESRSIVDEQDAFEGAEVTVDRAEPAPEDPQSRRRAVHAAARTTAEEMRRR
jgi:hypothetical protein